MIKIYLTSLILILCAACSITTNEIYKIYRNYKLVNLKINNPPQSLLKLLQVYIKKKNWLSCIIKVEQKIKKEKKLATEYYNIIGYCYYSLEIYYIATHYYQKAIEQEPDNIITLFSLGKIYKLTKQYKKAYKIYNQIITLDSSNTIARKQVKLLNKYL